METWRTTAICAAALLAFSFAGAIEAQDRGFDLALQATLLGGTGEPTNDILGYGVSGRFRLNDRWWIGVGIDRADEFDFERPAALFGLPVDFSLEGIDALGDSTIVSAWIERVYARGGRLEWFWGAGVGFNSLDIGPVEGPLTTGGSYRIVTDSGDELIATGRGGLRVRIGQRWSLELTLRADQHFADWKLTEEVTGATRTLDDYFIRGGTIGMRYRF